MEITSVLGISTDVLNEEDIAWLLDFEESADCITTYDLSAEYEDQIRLMVYVDYDGEPRTNIPLSIYNCLNLANDCKCEAIYFAPNHPFVTYLADTHDIEHLKRKHESPVILKMATLSLDLSEEHVNLLNHEADNFSDNGVYPKYEYGWYIDCNDTTKNSMSEIFNEIKDDISDIDIICIDSDA
ncbi:hypothetical protein J6A31_08920 [bacterium]|nr:hypothetical protein [bacterium]